MNKDEKDIQEISGLIVQIREWRVDDAFKVLRITKDARERRGEARNILDRVLVRDGSIRYDFRQAAANDIDFLLV